MGASSRKGAGPAQRDNNCRRPSWRRLDGSPVIGLSRQAGHAPRDLRCAGGALIMRVAFPKRLKRVEEARAPFAQALRDALGNAVEPDILIYTPNDEGVRIKTLSSVLAITSSGWLLIEETLAGGLS